MNWLGQRDSGTEKFRGRWIKVVVTLIGLALLARGQATIDVARCDRQRVIPAAGRYLSEKPVTITASGSPRSAGLRHDFFSERDYWWPDPKDPNEHHIQRDGMSN